MRSQHYSRPGQGQGDWERQGYEGDRSRGQQQYGGGKYNRSTEYDDYPEQRYSAQQDNDFERYGQYGSGNRDDAMEPGGWSRQDWQPSQPVGGHYGQQPYSGQGLYGREQGQRYGQGQQNWSDSYGRGSSRGSQSVYGGQGYGDQGSQRYAYGQSGSDLGSGYGLPAGQQLGQGGYGSAQSDYGYGQQDLGSERSRQYGRSGPKGFIRSDDRICEAVCERLSQAAAVDVSEVSVNVKEGCVQLEGTVPERRMKYAIEDIADCCFGVKDVENHIRVESRSSQSSGGSTSSTLASGKGKGKDENSLASK